MTDLNDLVVYSNAPAVDKLMWLQKEWREADSKHHRSFLEGRMMELTIGLEQHPEGFEHGCLCDLCCSYGE